MEQIPPTGLPHALPLFGAAATRALEAFATAQHPAHGLMEQAGLAVARWGRALYPHALRVWVACGPGNNGGDGLVAARHWQAALGPHGQVTATWQGDPTQLPPDARAALALARSAGVTVADTPPVTCDVVVDAVWGVGLQGNRPWPGHLHSWLRRVNQGTAPVLAVDVPSGLCSDTGAWLGPGDTRPGRGAPRHTLTLLTAKAGLFTGEGRETAGDTWLDTLGVDPAQATPTAWLNTATHTDLAHRGHRHNAHKGSHGDVAVLGGQGLAPGGMGMVGAAVLAARAALRGGAGRVHVGLLSHTHNGDCGWDPLQPELMFRSPQVLLGGATPSGATLVCGCGGGTELAAWLPQALDHPGPLVLDADALNLLAGSAALRQHLVRRHTQARVSVLTPHPLEAARLLGQDTPTVQANRLAAAATLAQDLQAVVVLKGSGTVVVAPGETPWINPTGNALLASAGTGDVLAGLVGAALARQSARTPSDALVATRGAVYTHGLHANQWAHSHPLTASDIR